MGFVCGNAHRYKAESAGGWVRKVDPRNTSQACSGCGAMPNERLTLGDRTYVCPHCGLVLDRDVNAAQNVLRVGLSGLPGGTAPVRSSEDEDYGSVGDGPRTQNRLPDDPGGSSCIIGPKRIPNTRTLLRADVPQET